MFGKVVCVVIAKTYRRAYDYVMTSLVVSRKSERWRYKQRCMRRLAYNTDRYDVASRTLTLRNV